MDDPNGGMRWKVSFSILEASDADLEAIRIFRSGLAERAMRGGSFLIGERGPELLLPVTRELSLWRRIVRRIGSWLIAVAEPGCHRPRSSLHGIGRES